MASQSAINTIQKAYIAYYGRPADPSGIEYWLGRMEDDGDDFYLAIDAFGVSKEFEQRYNDLSNEALINNIYLQAFDRKADDIGMNYYLNQLETGQATLATIALHIVDGAQASDLAQLNSKIEVANKFTQQVIDEGKDFIGSAAIEDAVVLINSTTPSSINVADYLIDRLTKWLMHNPDSFQTEYDDKGYQTRHEFDWNQDGMVDRVNYKTYDDQGRLIDQVEAGDHYSWQYDEKGLLVKQWHDLWGDETPEYTWNYFYDEAQNLIREERDTSGDHIPEEIKTYQYDAQNNLTYYSYDRDTDGESRHIEQYEYDTSGNQTLVSIDSDGDGILNSRFTYSYNDLGETLTIRDEQDWEDDGTIDYVLEYELDPSLAHTTPEPSESTTSQNLFSIMPLPDIKKDPDNFISKKIDINNDGIFDFSLRYEFDSHGHKTSQEVEVSQEWLNIWDTSGGIHFSFPGSHYVELRDFRYLESSAKSSWYYEYNDQDQVTLIETDHDDNGNIDHTETFTYTELGDLLFHEKDLNGDSVIDWSLKYIYNSSNQLQLIELEDDADDSPDSITSYHYDDQGYLSQIIHDYGADGIDDFIVNYSYNADGNLMTETQTRRHFDEEQSTNTPDETILQHPGSQYFGSYIYSWEYNSNGELIQYKQDLDADGSIDYSLQQAYSDDGELILIGESGTEYTGPVIYY